MAVNGSEFRWTQQKTEAAQLLAEDELSDKEICEKIELPERTLNNWKKVSEFQARIAETVEAIRTAILNRGIADKAKRIGAYDRRWRKMHSVIEARGKDLASDVAGGESGLLVRTVKQIGGGENAQIIEEYAVDTGLLRELRELEKQAAIEVGQWTEKKDITSKGEQVKAYVGIDVEKV